jgi:hypothetical protein
MDPLKTVIEQSLSGGAVKFVTGVASETTSLTVNEQYVKVTPPASGAAVIKLPLVSEAAGRFYIIETPTNDTGTVTVNTHDDDSPVMSDASLTAAGDVLMVFSTGTRWLTIVDITT